MKVSEGLQLYLDDCTIRGLSLSTIRNYRNKCIYFIDYVKDCDFEDLGEVSFQGYSRWLLSKPKVNNMTACKGNITRQTVRTYLNELRVFLSWCEKKGLCGGLQQFISLPKKHNKLVSIYTDSEIQRIFTAFDNRDSWIQFRNYALLALFYDSGLRREEACRLCPWDINFDSSMILVTGKGEKQRYVPMGKMTCQYLQTYMQLCPEHDNDEIFINQFKEPLTGNAIENIFYRIRIETGIKVSAHKLRHNFATNFLIMQYELKGHADIYQLMMVLGHSDVKTTMVYLHMAQQIVLGRQSISKLDSISKIMPSGVKKRNC